jgi:hypothetical protein
MTLAGHCSANGVLWSQGDFRVINPMEFRGPGGQSDEGVIHIPGSLGSNLVYAGDTSTRSITAAQLSHHDSVGMLTCASLGNSNRIDCGYITDRFGIADNRNGLRTNLRIVRDATARGGDSGSPWYSGISTAYGTHFGTIDGRPAYGHISALTRELTEFNQGTFTVRTN